MIWAIIKYLFLVSLIYLVYFCFGKLQEKRFYQSQGVVFCGCFPLVSDTIRLIMQSIKNPYDLPVVPYLKKGLGVDILPPFTGAMIFGMPCIFICDPAVLEDLYVKKNALYTKHEIERKFGPPLVYNNIVNMETEDPVYAPKRKVLSSAFFQNKVQKMVSMIKETTLD